jgi:carbon monoxide dehydrogenase subunit G
MMKTKALPITGASIGNVAALELGKTASETTITRSVVINAPRQRVWQAIGHEFADVSKLSPGVLESEITSQEEIGLGTTRHCKLSVMGAELDERITDWREDEYLGIDIYQWRNLPMVRSMNASFALSDEGEETRLEMSISYSVGMGPIGWLMNQIMMRRMNTKGWESFTAGIKHHIETGEFVDPDTRLNLAAVVS